MGWGDCGTDSEGRPIGYVWGATCDEPGCEKEIHRGLAYACGANHGGGDLFCEGYFCYKHLEYNFDANTCTCRSCTKHGLEI